MAFLGSVLLCDGVDEVCAQRLLGAGLRVTRRGKRSEAELMQDVQEHEVVVVRSATRVTACVLGAPSSRLRLVARAGTGTDNIDIGAATGAGVLVINAPGGNTISAAEHTCALIMAVSRHVAQACASLKEGRWDRKQYLGSELHGKTLAVVGLGRIGKEVASRMRGFGMRTIGYDPFVTTEQGRECGIEVMTLEQLWPQADYITVHTPLLPHTRGLVGDKVFSACKPGVRVVNCARGGIVDEAALLAALGDGRCGGAALDVFETEPPTNTALLQHPKVVCTPHLGASTAEAQTRVAEEVAAAIVAASQGKGVPGLVNLKEFSNGFSSPIFLLAQAMGRVVSSNIEGSNNIIDVRFAGTCSAPSQAAVVKAGVLMGVFRTDALGAAYSAQDRVTIQKCVQDESLATNSAQDCDQLVHLTFSVCGVENTYLGGTRGADCALLAVNGRPFPLPAPLAGPALLHHGPSSSSVQDVTELLARQKQSAALAGLYFTSPDAEDQRYVLACLDKNSATKQSNGVTNGHTRAL